MRIAQIDFDGTLIRNNIGIELMREFSKSPAETEEALQPVEPDFETGELDSSFREELLEAKIQRAWELADVYPQLMQNFSARRGLNFGGLKTIHAFLLELTYKGYTPVIVSNGLEQYIRAHVSPAYKVIATPAIWDQPNKCWHTAPNISMKQTFAFYMPVELYIGDSDKTDYRASNTITFRGGKSFAPTGSSLALANKGTQNFYTYRTFDDILAKL